MQLRGTNIVVDTVISKKAVVLGSSLSSGSAFTLNEYQSDAVVVLDAVAGTIFTLPDAKPGIRYNFITGKNLTSGSYIIQANAASQSYVITGDITAQVDNLTSGSLFLASPSNTAQKVQLNGGTTGGRIGSSIVVTAISSATWYVSGISVGTGSLATPFTT